MAVKKPLALYSGKIKELQTGDTVSGASASDYSYSPGSFTVVTETARMQINHVKLTGTQRITIQGTGRLTVIN